MKRCSNSGDIGTTTPEQESTIKEVKTTTVADQESTTQEVETTTVANQDETTLNL